MYQYLLYIGDFPVRMYGLILCASIFLATGVAYFLTKQDGRWHQHVPDMGIYCGLAGILGARLWDVFFFDWSYYQYHLDELLFVWQGGMAIQGGIVGGVLAGYVYTKIHRIDSWAFADIVAPAIVLGQALGRAANVLNGDAFGHPTGGDYGILYPLGTLARQTFGNAPLWPAEVWESQLDMAIFSLLLMFRTTNHAKGQAFLLYLILYSAARFGLEYLRGDYASVLWGLKSAQLTSLLVVVIAGGLFLWCGRRLRTTPPLPQTKKPTT